MNKPLILEGKLLAKQIEEDLKARVQKIKETVHQTPVLATLIVGGNPASVTYVKMKGNACVRVGIEPLKIELPESTTTEALLAKIRELNETERVHGILLTASGAAAD